MADADLTYDASEMVIRAANEKIVVRLVGSQASLTHGGPLGPCCRGSHYVVFSSFLLSILGCAAAADQSHVRPVRRVCRSGLTKFKP